MASLLTTLTTFQGKQNTLQQLLANPKLVVQTTLGFATMGLAANLGIATVTPLTDLRHYIIANLGITIANFGPFVVK